MSETTSTNLDVFLGILKGVAEKNDTSIPLHLENLVRDHQPQSPENLKEAIQAAGQSLEDAQCACLFANIVNLCVKDGRVTDRSFISDAREHLRLDRSDARDLEEAAEARFQADRVFRGDDDWAAFCAGLIAMTEADNITDAAEEDYLKKFVSPPARLAGRTLLEDGDEIGAILARFSSRQKRCLAAHAIAIMLIDGDWKGTEQGVLEKLNKQMHLSRVDAEKLMKGIHALYHVAVFA